VDNRKRYRLRELARRYLLPGPLGAVRGLAVASLALTTNVVLVVLVVTSLALVPALGIGFALFPFVVAAVRWRADLHRRIAGWSGVAVAARYRPLPPHAPLGSWRRLRHVVGDPATWRDLAWLLPGTVCGAVLGLLAFCLPLYGLEGLLLVPALLHVLIGWYGYGVFWPLDNAAELALTLPQGVVILAVGLAAAPWLVWLDARVAGLFLGPTRTAQLRQRIEQLTVTRADTVDAQSAELRRIERDLHDGAQARLVSLGMNIGLAEELLPHDPAAARELLAQARESSGQALAELRDLVRGIHPPVLAERGLEGAVRALAFATPLPVGVDVDLPGRPPAPVESAAYFAVAEALTNVAKHSRARVAWVTMVYRAGKIAIKVGDDGVGGAHQAAGTGLRGVDRRLAAFDGTMTVSSPPGGPTIITMELPCVLSSPRTSPSSETG
jgi:signal transduction histidine kinase